jgi:hypothetical protein
MHGLDGQHAELKTCLAFMLDCLQGQEGPYNSRTSHPGPTKVLPLILADSQVVLLGDAEYDTTEMLLWVKQQQRWDFVLRTSPQIYV